MQEQAWVGLSPVESSVLARLRERPAKVSVASGPEGWCVLIEMMDTDSASIMGRGETRAAALIDAVALLSAHEDRVR